MNSIKQIFTRKSIWIFIIFLLLLLQIIVQPIHQVIKILFINALVCNLFLTLSVISVHLLAGVHIITSAKWSNRQLKYSIHSAKIFDILPYTWLIVIALSGSFVNFTFSFPSLIDLWKYPLFIYLRTFFLLFLWKKMTSLDFNTASDDSFFLLNQRKIILNFIIIIFTSVIFIYDWLMIIPENPFINLWTVQMIVDSLQIGLAVSILGLLNQKNENFEFTLLNNNRKYLLTLSFAWIYLNFCWWLIAWYAGLAEETALINEYFSWPNIMFSSFSILLNLVIPLGLLLKKSSSNLAKMLIIASLSVLIGKYVDLLAILFQSVYN